MSEKTYLKRNTKLTNYVILPRPKEISGISNTAKLVYALILARGTLSQKNDKWIEADDRVTLVYTEKSIAEELNCKERTVINAINELKKENLLEVKEDSKGRANVVGFLSGNFKRSSLHSIYVNCCNPVCDAGIMQSI